ncbi:protein of unknown function [Nitrospira japonica]|uniref:Uncharacterized protein n=1 Tax=Nitrospira japonica TaxID=1325564 RepID=A0A1W1I1T1_9BACT|nr:protein of unknown function [Nitrospira japonica]
MSRLIGVCLGGHMSDNVLHCRAWCDTTPHLFTAFNTVFTTPHSLANSTCYHLLEYVTLDVSTLYRSAYGGYHEDGPHRDSNPSKT